MLDSIARIPARAALVPLLAGALALQACGSSDTPRATVPPSNASAAVQQQFNDVIRRVSPQVVQIQTSRGLGSGVVYDRQGDIVTNAHVVGSVRCV